MTPGQVDAGWAALAGAASYTHYRSLGDAAQRLIAEAQTERRVMTGIPVFDREMRGISPGHLLKIDGYSHSGKTLVALHMIRHNRNRRVAYFVPDEPAPLVLTKLACQSWGVSGGELEARVASGDPWGLKVLNETIEEFPTLAVFDRPLTPRAMQAGYDEACTKWGAPGDLVIVDYLDLLQAGDSVSARADYVKTFGTTNDVPMAVCHQTSRSAGSRGQSMRIDSGAFGGETHATFQIGVWRRKSAIVAELQDLESRVAKTEWAEDRIDYLQRELQVAQYTITLNLNKNKRPSGRLVDDTDFELDVETGCLWPLHPSEFPRQCYGRHLRAVED